MYWPPARRFELLMITALLLPLLAACGGGGNEADQDAVVNPTSPPTEVSVAQELPTEENNAPPAPPEAPLVVATVSDDEPIIKDVPAGSAPTQVLAPPSDFDSDGDGMYTADEFQEAIRYLFPTYEWPDNYQVTADIIIDGMNVEAFPGSGWEAPGEYTIIGMYHSCAWELALLVAVHENDATLMEESLYQLKDIGLTKNPLSNDENGKAMMREMYDRAALGDPAPLQQWVDNNCDHEKDVFITPDSGTPAATSFTIPQRPPMQSHRFA